MNCTSENCTMLRRDPGGQFRVPRAAAGGWKSQYYPKDSFLNNHWYLHPWTEDVTGLEPRRPVCELSSYHHKLLIWNTYSCLPETQTHTTPRAALQDWPGGKKCFHHLAASQEHLDCPGHTAGWGRLLTHEVPSLMSSSSYTTTSPGIISIFRSIKNCFFFSSSTKAWLVLTRPVLSETAFYIPDVLSTPQSNRRCILCQINKHKSLGKSWVKQPESISSASRFYSFLNGNIQAQFAFPTQQLSFSAIRGEWCITKSDLLD